MSIFTSKQVYNFLLKIQLTKSDPKRTEGGKCPASCLLLLGYLIKTSAILKLRITCLIKKNALFMILLQFRIIFAELQG